MKICTNIKRITISLIVLIILLSLILINFKSYIIDNTFNILTFILSILLSIVSCALFAVKINFNKKANKYISIISIVISILFCYMIIELLNQNSLFSIYPKRLVFNFIVIILLHLLLYGLSNKINLTIILCNTVIFILGIVNYTVTCFRGTPLVPWDILSIKTAAYVASSYTFHFNHFLLLAISLYMFILSIGLKANYKIIKGKFILLFRLFSISIVILLTFIFYKTDVINYFDFENNLWKPKDEYLNNGFLASFLKQSKNLFNDVPKNYSSTDVKNIFSKTIPVFNYESIDEKPNIIVIMNESYSDLSVNRKF